MNDIEALRDVLLDQQHRQPLAVEPPDQGEHLLDHQRRKTKRWLIEYQKLRLRHQSPADRQHLLLAAGQRAGELTCPLAQPREVGKDALAVRLAPRRCAGVAADVEIFAHRHVGKNASPFGNMKQAGCNNLSRL